MGAILIGGMASLLICIFLGPKFIDLLRAREFGQHIREEGPEGHAGKAGTPTMGGLAVFGTAIASAAVGFADDWIKLRKRRSLGISGRAKLLVQAGIALALWLIVTDYVGLEDSLRLRIFDAT